LLGHGAFSAAVMNPPYFSGGKRNDNASYARSRHEAPGALAAFLGAAFRLLNNGGKLFMIYPACAACDLLAALREHRLEPKRLKFVYSKSNRAAIRVLVEAKKLGGAGVIVEPPAWMQQPDENK
jgi:tRNA1(Val) A37 N6-methylase TrmN6